MNKVILWASRILAAVIMLQTLYFKFTAADESVEIFTALGMEPWGRIATGVLELVASILILVPAASWVGAGLALGLMAGAIVMHLTILGIEVRDDGGYLFFLALLVSACSVYVLWVSRSDVRTAIRRVLAV